MQQRLQVSQLIVPALLLLLCQGVEIEKNQPDAIVTILFGKGFELGVRVLGQSIRESKTKLDYVVMCTHDVPPETIQVLKKDGWKVKMIDYFNVGEAKFDNRIYKMKMWTLTEYRRIIWVDADAILVQNIDHLVRCGNFCATYRHSDLFNSGIMVIKPSLLELKKITAFMSQSQFLKDPNTDSASNIALPPGCEAWGDQNLLNEYYNSVYKVQYSRLFDEQDPTYHEEPMRLPEGYNCDYGLYLLDGSWAVEDKDRYIMHYTAGPLKPQLWWTYPFCNANWIWLGLRQRLPSRYNDPSIWSLFNWIPLLVVTLLLVAVRFCPSSPQLVSYCKTATAFISPQKDNWIMFFTPTTLLLFSYYFSFKQVTNNLWPGEAWVVFGMWTIMFISIFIVPVCYIFYISTSPILRGIQLRMTLETLLYFVVFILLHLLFLWIIYFVYPFIRRSITFCILLFGIIIYFHFASKRLMRLWHIH